jgi:hypothetical protein
MVSVSDFVVVCALVFGYLQVVDSRKVVLNEDELMGTCSGTCEGIPVLYVKKGCKKISNCATNSIGWNRGIYRCDYCLCNCDEDTTDENKDILVEKTPMSFVEYKLYDTCSGTCDKKGLVRTDFKDCQKVENCTTAANGYLSGVYRCDYCTCMCINKRDSNKYTLTNVKYDASKVNLKEGRPMALAQTILEVRTHH